MHQLRRVVTDTGRLIGFSSLSVKIFSDMHEHGLVNPVNKEICTLVPCCS